LTRPRLRGLRRVRRVLKGIPENMRVQLVSVLNNGGRALQSAMRARAPSKTGAVRSGISYRVLPKTLRLRVGLLGTKRGRADLFYGRIQDLGRKEQVVTVQRRRRVQASVGDGEIRGLLLTRGGRKRAEDIVTTYQMRVKAMPPKRFITGSYPVLRSAISNALKGIWGRALKSIAGGSDE